MKPNHNYQNVQNSYLFAEIAKRVRTYEESHPHSDLIRLGIGDVTLPLAPAVIAAMESAVKDMAGKSTFRGYGPEQGYPFLRETIAAYYLAGGVQVDADEIYVGDGAKSDIGNVLDLFDQSNTVLVPDPVYPVYVDTNRMDGRTIDYMNGTPENGFLPMPDEKTKADLIYLCSPNNPTGAVYSAAQLKAWVDFANQTDAVILYDAAYEAFIADPGLPRSIFSIDGARTCAIEFCSLSKTAGFTGVRASYTVVPKELSRGGMNLGDMWLRRQSTKFNGVPYVTQRAAQAALSGEGLAQCRQMIAYYRQNADIIADMLKSKGIYFTGGVHSPYLWLACGMPSWAFFDLLLKKARVVGTPGAGFGQNGEGFFRLTAFGDQERTREACARIMSIL